MPLFTDSTLVHHLNRLSFLLDTSGVAGDTRQTWAQEELSSILAHLVYSNAHERRDFLRYLKQVLPLPAEALAGLDALA